MDEISNWIAILGCLKDNDDVKTAQNIVDSIHQSRDKVSQILRPRISKAQTSTSAVDPSQKQITTMLTKLEEHLRECKNELDAREYCNAKARLIEAETLIRPNGNSISF